MDLSRTLSGNPPLIMNVMVNAASTISDGALLAFSANAVTTTAASVGATISVASTSGAGDDAIGVTQVSSAQASAAKDNSNAMNAYRFNIPSDGIANSGMDQGGEFLPLCVNPDALYYAEYSITTTTGTPTASDAAVNGISASTGTAVTIASTSILGKAGSWIMDGRTGATQSASSAAPTFNGQLRFVATGAADSFGLLTAMNASINSNILWTAPQFYNHTLLKDPATVLGSQFVGSTAPKFDQGIWVTDNFVAHAEAPLHPLRQWVDDGLNGLTNNRLYSEVHIKKMYGAV